MDKHTLSEVEQEVAEIISQVTGTNVDRSTDSLEPLQLDSLSRLEIMTLLEKRFQLVLIEDVATQFKSISRIARIILHTMEEQPLLSNRRF